jgi:hypothetical protein
MPVRKWGFESVVNTTQTGSQLDPAIAALSGGGHVIAWQDGNPAGVIRAQRYDAAGNPVGDEILVEADANTDNSDPSVAALNNDRFVITWSDPAGRIGNNHDISARIYDANGNVEASHVDGLVPTAGNHQHSDVTVNNFSGFSVVSVDFAVNSGDPAPTRSRSRSTTTSRQGSNSFPTSRSRAPAAPRPLSGRTAASTCGCGCSMSPATR